MNKPFNHPVTSIAYIEGGHQFVFKFDNNYGASVVSHRFSYGGDEGKWELAVIKWEGERWDICCDTPITGDVLGWLTVPEVDALLTQIQNLKD